MNLHYDLNRPRVTGENSRLWQDGRVWWVNCVAIEAAWSTNVASEYLNDARRQRDLMLTALIEMWS